GARRRWLAAQSQARGFKVIEARRPLTPAEARNLGAAQARTEFVLFIENDVIPMRNWLSRMVACADETGADAVVPMTCEGRPLHAIVHHVGGEDDGPPDADAEGGAPDFKEVFHQQGLDRATASSQFSRRRTSNCEMHCLLVRRSALEKVGPFDPEIVSKEYLDFSWRFAQAQLSFWVEPEAVVTFLIPSESDPIRIADVPYFLLRWSPHWQTHSHDLLQQKWGLREAGFIGARRKLADWRIIDHLVKPALKTIPVLGKRWGFVERGSKVLYPLAAAGAAVMARRHARLRRRALDKDRAGANA
ncbi:MAG TPA: glycosyltransferase, partial [Hyphomonadaceae bacterium]|nr:glycosyltransferase [Hyphomonadaceae bacterium]